MTEPATVDAKVVDADWAEVLLAPSVAALKALPADCKQLLRVGGAMSVLFRLVIGRRERGTDETMHRPERYACVRPLQRFQALLCRENSPLRQLAHETFKNPARSGTVPDAYVDGIAPEHLLRGAMIVEGEGVLLFRETVAFCDNQPGSGKRRKREHTQHANSKPGSRVGMDAPWADTHAAINRGINDAMHELRVLADVVPERAAHVDRCLFELQRLHDSFA